MNIKFQINDQEIRQAVCEWLSKNHGINVEPSRLEPLYETVGQYEDSVTSQIGFEVQAESVQELLSK